MRSWDCVVTVVFRKETEDIMPRNKEEVEAEKKRKMIKELQKGPDLSQFVEDKKKKYVSY